MIEIIDEQYNVNQELYLPKLETIANQLEINPQGTIVIKLGDETLARELNKQYREIDEPTDVLSFPLNEELPEGFHVGDIFICYPVAQAQATENNIPVEDELLHLMIHGMIHLCGYDHETDSGEMEELEKKLLDNLNT